MQKKKKEKRNRFHCYLSDDAAQMCMCLFEKREQHVTELPGPPHSRRRHCRAASLEPRRADLQSLRVLRERLN